MLLKRLICLSAGLALFPLFIFWFPWKLGVVEFLALNEVAQPIAYMAAKGADFLIRFVLIMLIGLFGVAFWKMAFNPRLSFKEACAEALEFLGQRLD